MKACTRCDSTTNRFNKRIASLDGLCHICRVCQSELRKRYWLERERNNPETNVKRKKRDQAYNERHPARVRAAKAAYAEAHPEECHVRILVCKHNKRAAGELSTEYILGLVDSQQGKCDACRKPLDEGYHIDHIVPVCKGGTNAASNIHLLCPDCNYHKQSMDYQAFLVKREAEIHASKGEAGSAEQRTTNA